MRVLVTGASGFIGSAVVRELQGADHEVIGFVRSAEAADKLVASGVRAARGTLDDLNELRSGVAMVDGVIHTAFNHDFSRFAENAEQDRKAIEAIGDALAGSDRPFLVTSGLALMASGPVATERDLSIPTTPQYPRVSEPTTAALRARGVRASVVRLPPSVHGTGEHGFVPILINLAREKGFAAYVGEGTNRWPAVHRFDAARLFRLALEHGAQAEKYHAIAEEGIAFRKIAEVIARRLSVPLVALSPENAADYFGWFYMFAGMDAPASSAITRALLDWQPQHPTLIEDIDQPDYFAT